MACSGRKERELRELGYSSIAGVDEVGRGCLLGPVYAAAVVLDPRKPIRGLNDSKQIHAERREVLRQRIMERAICWAIGTASCEEIDRINILQASRLAMRRAVEALRPCADYLLVDAVTVEIALPQEAIIKGDATCQCIAAASILAKQARDEHLTHLSSLYPQYGLERNKGYGTPEHLTALAQFGPTPEHRRSFLPVQQYSLEF